MKESQDFHVIKEADVFYYKINLKNHTTLIKSQKCYKQ